MAATRYRAVERETLVLVRVGSEPVLLVVGPDNESVRAFSRVSPGGRAVADFYRLTGSAAFMMDIQTASLPGPLFFLLAVGRRAGVCALEYDPLASGTSRDAQHEGRWKERASRESK